MTQQSNPLIQRLDPLVDWKEQKLGGLREGKTVCITRYGAIGDMIQTSALLPGFKKLGYKITVNTQPLGYHLLQNDPHVDEFFIQERDQVKNEELGRYWYNLSLLFDRYVNLSECVEGSLLAIQGRAPYMWNKEARHRYMNHNYVEFMHLIAGIPYEGNLGKFYPTTKEDKWAKRFIKKLPVGTKTVLWVLSGSTLHKASPWVDQVIARFMIQTKNVHFLLVGDYACQILEGGSWKNEPRVHPMSGDTQIREVLALLPYVDCVVGPETGVVDASGGLEETGTVLFLSHASKENLSRDWKNTITLEPKECKCYPCHILHYTPVMCDVDEEFHATRCTMNVDDDMIAEAIRKILFKE